MAWWWLFSLPVGPLCGAVVLAVWPGCWRGGGYSLWLSAPCVVLLFYLCGLPVVVLVAILFACWPPVWCGYSSCLGCPLTFCQVFSVPSSSQCCSVLFIVVLTFDLLGAASIYVVFLKGVCGPVDRQIRVPKLGPLFELATTTLTGESKLSSLP